jgi:hypothetical protein
MDGKCLRFLNTDPDSIQFKYDFREEFRTLKVTTSKKRERPSANDSSEIPKKYKSKLPISLANKNLINLCKFWVIPSEYHEYYKSLPSNSSVVESLADPDVQEDDIDSD